MASSKTCLATLSGIWWGTAPTASYDVIIEGITDSGNAKVSTLSDETDKVIAVATAEENLREIKFTCTIKGSGHLAQDALVGAIISNLDDAYTKSPIIITGNSLTKTKGTWSTCECTGNFIGANASEQSLENGFTTV